MLLTKLHIPQTKENVVHRSDLFAKLNEGLNRKLILVSATAGYGKTTLVSDWLNQIKIPTAWYSADSHDNDQYEFLSFIISAVQTVHKNIGHKSLELLKSPGTIEIAYICELLINDILTVQSDFLLVIDDLHLIASKEVHKIISFLVDYKPRQFKIAILTRSDPPLSLARLRSQNELMEIRSSDLGFTEHETTEFFNKKLKLGLTPKDINLIELKTEGWIAGLQLTAITLQNKENVSEFINRIAGDNRYIMDYLIEEVLNNLDNETRDFLLKTSVLEKLSGSLCNSVLQINNSQFILESLEKNNMFIVPLDNKRQWFRYHHLFGDLLKQRLLIKHKEIIEELHNNASIWFESNDMPLMAIEHALGAGNVKKGIELIDEIMDHLVETSQYPLILKYAELFSDEDIFSNIKFGILYAWSLTITGRLAEAEKLLAKIERKVLKEDNMDETKGLLGIMYTTYSLLNDFKGDEESALKNAELALKHIPQHELVWNSWAYYCKAGPHLLRLELDESIASLSNGLKYAINTQNAYLEIVHNKVAYLLRLKGRYSDALNICNEMLKNSDEYNNNKGIKINLFTSVIYSTIGSIIVEQGRTNEGIDMALKGFELSQKLVSISFRGYGRLLLAETYYKAGEFKYAVDTIEKHDTNLKKNLGHWLTVLSNALKLKLLCLMGQKEEAESFYAQNIKPAQNHYFEYCLYRIATAHFFISTYRYNEAESILDALSSVLKNKKAIELYVEVELLKVKILLLRGKETDAGNCVANLLKITQVEGYVRMYVNEGSEIECLIKEIKQQKKIKSSEQLNAVSTEYLNKLIKAFENEKKTNKSASGNVLSARELDTLKLLAEDYSNQQIADELYISLNTVKTHLKNINLKLEVDSRIKAVEKAKYTGII